MDTSLATQQHDPAPRKGGDNKPKWHDNVKKFAESSWKESMWQLLSTSVLYIVAWIFAYASLRVSMLLSALFCIFAGMLTVRIFIFSHDCGHNSFTPSSRANEIIGFITGVVTLTPFRRWRKDHALHHRHSGKIEERGVGYFDTMTLDEYRQASSAKRFWYRYVYRNPWVYATVGGLFLFVIQHRFSSQYSGKAEKHSVWWTNISLLLIFGVLGFFLGFAKVLAIQAFICFVGFNVGVLLFYLQHHYDNAYWAPKDEWNVAKAAIEGSSYVQLPGWMCWLVGNINYHHVHHYNPKIPNYELPRAHHGIPAFNAVVPLTWRQIREAFSLALIDERTNRWVTYPDDV